MHEMLVTCRQPHDVSEPHGAANGHDKLLIRQSEEELPYHGRKVTPHDSQCHGGQQQRQSNVHSFENGVNGDPDDDQTDNQLHSKLPATCRPPEDLSNNDAEASGERRGGEMSGPDTLVWRQTRVSGPLTNLLHHAHLKGTVSFPEFCLLLTQRSNRFLFCSDSSEQRGSGAPIRGRDNRWLRLRF